MVKSEALCPATALPVTLGGRNSHRLTTASLPPYLHWVISRPSEFLEPDEGFRRCSCRKFCAALGAVLIPLPGAYQVWN